ncbi:hypothetical protein EMCG_09620 [[Emmonsia] crescens]|uniref:Uncharacterized protein n=1 Tax=[Emmonsia] crescens TaxID=73230 RepID=A0A0G2I1E1_9EURO|nr:hypothetical protein EMCG_09620 [Emmonsia crescens UAMH 3008]
MSSPSEPSILEYARFHNIANNGIPDPFLLIPPPSEDIDVSLCDISSRPSVDFEGIQREIQAGTREKLDASWASAPLLLSILKSSIAEISTSNHYEESEYSPHLDQIRDLKLEAPVLRTDHDMDMRSFRRRISLDFMEMDVPLERLDDENDESLKFQRSFWSQPKRVWDMAQGERLSCMKEGLMFMQGIKSQIVETGKRDIDDWLDEGIVICGKLKDIDPQTPILLPRDPTPVPFVPSSPCLDMEILPDPETPPMAEYQGIEIIEDTLMPNCEQIVTNFLTATDDVESPELLPGRSNETPQDSSTLTLSSVVKNGILNLKVETPITPPVSTKKRPAENDEDILNAMARTGVVPEIPSHDPMEIEQDNLVEEDLAEVVSAAKRKADDDLNGEQIRGINTMTRSKVPYLKSPIMVPPWPAVAGLSESELRGLYRSFISEIKQKDLAGLRYAVGEYSRKNLKWQPFAMEVRRLDVEENIMPEDALGGFLLEIGRLSSGSENEVESFTSVYHDDFRLSSLDDNEELTPRTVCEEIGPALRLQGQGYEHVAVTNETKRVGLGYSQTDKQHTTVDNLTGGSRAPNFEMNPKSARATHVDSTLLSVFSPLESLSNFMEVRGRRPTASSSDICPSDPSVLAHDNQHPKISSQTPERLTQPNTRTTLVPLLVAPSTSRPQNVLTFILSTSLLRTHRALVHKLESLSPACNLIFRDYSTPPHLYAAGTWSLQPQLIPPTQHYPKSPQSSEGQEADISLSPTAGILLTTTQEITQKYLPGHQPNGQGIAEELDSPVRQRISNICLLYEKVFVFICNPIVTPNKNNLTVPHAEMGVRIVKAVDSLKTFCESFSHFSTITVVLVVNDPSHITNWLVSLANTHCIATPWPTSNTVHELSGGDSVLFPEDSSPSELFLRQAGLNTFAAQMVLLHLHENGDDRNESYDSGNYPTQGVQNPQAALSRFVGMTPFERQHLFTPILGQRVLERMERRLAVEQR